PGVQRDCSPSGQPQSSRVRNVADAAAFTEAGGNIVTVTSLTAASNAYSMNRFDAPKCVMAVRLRSESASRAGVIHSDQVTPSAETRTRKPPSPTHDTAAD